MSFDYKRMIKFEHNVGDKEKNYRMYAGAALILISIFTASVPLLLIGLILVGTGFSGWCPVYSGLNRNTCTPAGEAAVEAVESAVAEAVDKVEEVAAEVAETVKEAVSEVVEKVEEVAAEVVETVKDVTVDAAEAVEAAAAKVAAAVKGDDGDKPADS